MFRFPFRRLLLVTAAVGLACFVMSCSSSDSPTGTGGGTKTSPNTINISGMDFTPGGKTFAVGTTVKWVNKDGVNHTVTSDNGTFASGTMVSGDTFQFTFTAAGTFPYHCAVHPSMKDTITVAP